MLKIKWNKLNWNNNTYKSGLIYIIVAIVWYFCISTSIYTSFEIGNIPFLSTDTSNINTLTTIRAVITNISFQLLGRTTYFVIFILFTNGCHLCFAFSYKRKKYLLWLVIYIILTTVIINIITPTRLNNYYAGGCVGYITSKLFFMDLLKQQKIYIWQLLLLLCLWFLTLPFLLSINLKAIWNKIIEYTKTFIKKQKTQAVIHYQHPKLPTILRTNSTNNMYMPSDDSIYDNNKNDASVSNDRRLFGTTKQNFDNYQIPNVSLLDPVCTNDQQEEIQTDPTLLLQALEEFSIKGEIINIHHGPIVTIFEFKPAPGIKIARIISLNEDIAREISAISIRIAKLPGKNVLGIEIPNENRKTVYFSQVVNNSDQNLVIPLFLGQDVFGNAITCDLTRMPHLLIAGTTGSGKSVSINTMILSVLFKFPHDKCKFIMIDPKMLELSIYNDIPHLLTRVVTDANKAVQTLNWAISIMEKRYRQMAQFNVRNIDGFNKKLLQAKDNPDLLVKKTQIGFDSNTGVPKFETQYLNFEYMPYIVIVIDELADLMLVAGKEVEEAIRRLSQMARAAGIHLILATQRPSVDVITGTIKSNLPTRISFQVASKIDSRTILGEQGAEQLLGQGDMLYMPGACKMIRIHGAYVSDIEIERIVDFIKNQGIQFHDEQAEQNANILNENANVKKHLLNNKGDITTEFINKNRGRSDLYNQAVLLVRKSKKCSVSYIQKNLNVSYNEAARMLETMEQQEIISQPDSNGKRRVL